MRNLLGLSARKDANSAYILMQRVIAVLIFLIVPSLKSVNEGGMGRVAARRTQVGTTERKSRKAGDRRCASRERVRRFSIGRTRIRRLTGAVASMQRFLIEPVLEWERKYYIGITGEVDLDERAAFSMRSNRYARRHHFSW